MGRPFPAPFYQKAAGGGGGILGFVFRVALDAGCGRPAVRPYGGWGNQGNTDTGGKAAGGPVSVGQFKESGPAG